MKVFYLSLPFDEENSGDYDYCLTSSKALQDIAVDSQYVIGANIQGYDSVKAKNLLTEVQNHRSIGGKDFYTSLRAFYSNEDRTKLAGMVKNHLISDESTKKILNLQLRAPETGFLLSPLDISELKSKEIKICITCHEYKLNYDRRWLQTVLHPYFELADLVFFFSEKDLKNASKHADHSAFLDRVDVSNINPSACNHHDLSSKLLTKPLIETYDSLSGKKFDRTVFKADKLKKLECGLFAGKFETAPGARVSMNGKVEVVFATSGSNPVQFTGIAKDIKIDTGKEKVIAMGKEKVIAITGIALDISLYEPTKAPVSDSYEFCRKPYELKAKAVLTRVAPTAFSDTIDPPEQKQMPNIIIFGMIGEGKGYEATLSIAKAIVNSPFLNKVRVLIVGNPSCKTTLTNIICAKFDLRPSQNQEVSDFFKAIDQGSMTQGDALLNIASLVRSIQTEQIKKFLFKQRVGKCAEILHKWYAAESQNTEAISGTRALSGLDLSKPVKDLVPQIAEKCNKDDDTESKDCVAAFLEKIVKELPQDNKVHGNPLETYKSLESKSNSSEGQNRPFMEAVQQQKNIKHKLLNPSFFQSFVEALETSLLEELPIDIFLDVSKEQLPAIFAYAKYAVKFDGKGWANNASSLINMLAYGCILYTGWGMCTESEVTSGKYKGAIVLPKGKYCLREGRHLDLKEEEWGKRSHFNTSSAKNSDIKRNLVKPEDILNDICARERWPSNAKVEQKGEDEMQNETTLISNRNNVFTLDLSRLLLKSEFHPHTIAENMKSAFTSLYNKSIDSSSGAASASALQPSSSSASPIVAGRESQHLEEKPVECIGAEEGESFCQCF